MKMRVSFQALLLASIVAALACSSPQSSNQVLMKFHALQRIPGSDAVAVILSAQNGNSFLPLSIDREQALSIYQGQNDIASARPQSHDLMAQMLESLNAKVQRIVITDLRDNVYYAQLELRRGEETLIVDARPSDAIALALRVDAPIFAMQHLLDAGMAGTKADEAFAQARVRSWGFTVQEVSGTLQRFYGGQAGVLVVHKELDTPAEQADLFAGDLILKIDGERVTGLESFSAVMAEKTSQSKLQLQVVRGQETVSIHLTKHN